jgi:hypothetical protein
LEKVQGRKEGVEEAEALCVDAGGVEVKTLPERNGATCVCNFLIFFSLSTTSATFHLL